MERSHTLRPATADDIPRLVEILYAAFADDQVLKTAYPDTPRNRTWWYRQYEDLLPRGRFVVAVKPGSHAVGVGSGTEGKGGDGEGMEKEEVVVAFGGWMVVEQDNARDGNASENASMSASESASASARKSATESATESASASRIMVEAAEPTSEMDWVAMVALAQARRRLRDSVMGTDGTYHWLNVIATHPAHRGHGAASSILRWGIEQAERDNAEILILLTGGTDEAARRLYEKFGWTVRETQEVWEGLTMAAMIRPANTLIVT